MFQDDEEEESANVEESRVGKKLSEITTRRVIGLVLGMLLLLPAFRAEGYELVLVDHSDHFVQQLSISSDID